MLAINALTLQAFSCCSVPRFFLLTAEYFNITPDLYSIHVIPMTAHTLEQLIGTVQTVQSNGETFQYFLL